MEVIEIKEQKDGSAIVELDITEEEKNLLINVGFNTMLKKGITLMENNLIGIEEPEEQGSEK